MRKESNRILELLRNGSLLPLCSKLLGFLPYGVVYFSFLVLGGGCSKIGVSVSPNLWKSCNQTPLVFKVIFPEDSQALYQVPRLGNLMWGSKPSQEWENFFGLIVLQFVGHPPGGYGVWFLLWLCSSHCLAASAFWSLGMWYLFLVVSIILLKLVVQQLVMILVVSQEKMSTHLSTPPSWTRSFLFVFFNKLILIPVIHVN